MTEEKITPTLCLSTVTQRPLRTHRLFQLLLRGWRRRLWMIQMMLMDLENKNKLEETEETDLKKVKLFLLPSLPCPRCFATAGPP